MASAASVFACDNLRSPHSVVSLSGTPHVLAANSAGILHWAGETRAPTGKAVYGDWDDRAEASLSQLKAMAIGDPWLSTGLVKS